MSTKTVAKQSRNKLKIKQVFFEKFVAVFGLEKAERIFKIFDSKPSKQ
jgi:hypothetical protein